MPDELLVLMGGTVAGRLTRHANNRLEFDYDPTYRRGRGTSLSLSMPITIGHHTDTQARRPVTNFLWGLLPDNDTVLERWSRHYRVRRSSPFFLLGTPVGEDCAGAVSFCAPTGLERLLARGGAVEWLTEDDVATLLRDLRTDQASWLMGLPNRVDVALVVDGRLTRVARYGQIWP